MKRILRLDLLCVAVTFTILTLTKYLLSVGSPMASLPQPFTEWCVAAYNPQNAEEVADMEILIAGTLSAVVTSALACLALLLRKSIFAVIPP